MIENANKRENSRKYVRQTVIVLLVALFCMMVGTGCAAEKLDPSAETIVITDLAQLKSQDFAGFDQLKTLDLRAVAADAATVDALQAKLPNAEIVWKVPLGSESFDSTSGTLTLPQSCKASDLALLRYFPALTQVDATGCIVGAAFAEAAAAYPGVAFSWNATIGGILVKSSDTSLDLTGQTISVDEVKPFLLGLNALQQVVCNNLAWSAEELADL